MLAESSTTIQKYSSYHIDCQLYITQETHGGALAEPQCVQCVVPALKKKRLTVRYYLGSKWF